MILLAPLLPIDRLICTASTFGFTVIGGTTFGFPAGAPLKGLAAWCKINVPLELEVKGFGSFKIVRAEEPIGNSIPFTPGFEYEIVLKLAASDVTEVIPLPPKAIFLLSDGIEGDFVGLARYMRLGLMSAFNDDA